jgi:hypothetical protein
MTDRRRFLQTAAALSAAPLAARVAFAEGRPALLLDALVVDERHREARAFGSRARSLGAPVRPIDGDITQLWQHELLGRWRARPAAVAGLTERPALFLLERLGWDHSLRVVFQAEHAANGAGGFRHTLRRSGASDLALDLAAAGPGWPAVLADAFVAGSPPPARNLRPTDAALAARDEATTLYSWIIAPRQA